MIRLVLLVSGLVACTTGQDMGRLPRWPEHRKQHDAALEELRAKLDQQQLELNRMADVLIQLQRQQRGAPAPLADPPGPSRPSTPPVDR